MVLFNPKRWLSLDEKKSEFVKNRLFHYYLYSISDVLDCDEKLLCIKDVNIGNEFVTMTDTRDVTSDYSLYLYPRPLLKTIFFGGILCGIAVRYL